MKHQRAKSFSIAIVGCGPRGTYALERLAAMLPTLDCADHIEVLVFERSGEFGAGATQSAKQCATGQMNRVSSQIAFAADQTNQPAAKLLKQGDRPTLYEWSRVEFEKTGDAKYVLEPMEMPSRAIHGEALSAAFERYKALLEAAPNVVFTTIPEDVTDIVEMDGDRFCLVTRSGSHPADRVLLVTGHAPVHAPKGSRAATLAQASNTLKTAKFVPYIYPTKEKLSTSVIAPGSEVAVLGLGLAGVDSIISLTEGRGGRFVKVAEDTLKYYASGQEPKVIVGLSRSGLPVQSRGENDKAATGSGVDHARKEHQGQFLTLEAVQHLRNTVGVACVVSNSTVKQLDYSRDIFPLVVLEMAYVYYRTLLGPRFAAYLIEAVTPAYEAHLSSSTLDENDAIEALMHPVHNALDRFAAAQPQQDQTDPNLHRFCWKDVFYPVRAENASPGSDWHEKTVAHIRRDNLFSAQGNMRNPLKAATDGVWRDLRAVYAAVLDYGGLQAQSHADYLVNHHRLYTRMSNGTSLAATRKLVALAEAGFLDLSMGPNPVVDVDVVGDRFGITSYDGVITRHVSSVIDARVPAFDPERDGPELYRNLFQRGMVRRWKNPGINGQSDFEPGALDLDKGFHPYKSDGSIEVRLAVIGAPAEGLIAFQYSAAKPYSNNGILNDIAAWANEVVDAITDHQSVTLVDACSEP
ncbi:MAG: FAD/NAD(P)-binding protein [Sulfitobacter sp.]